MKLVLFQQSDASPQLPGLLTNRGVVDISGVVRSSYTPQLVMEGIIDEQYVGVLPPPLTSTVLLRPSSTDTNPSCGKGRVFRPPGWPEFMSGAGPDLPFAVT